MNAAEITDKLGLHSLRQRAWVSHCSPSLPNRTANLISYSTSSLPALRLETVSTRVSSGSATRSERLATTKRTPLIYHTTHLQMGFPILNECVT